MKPLSTLILLGSILAASCAPPPLQIPRATATLSLSLAGLFSADRQVQVATAGTQARVTVRGLDLPDPLVVTAPITGQSTVASLTGIPVGPNRLVELQALDASGSVLPGSRFRTTVTLQEGPNAAAVSAATTPRGDVLAALLDAGSPLAATLPADALQERIEAIARQQRLPHFALIDGDAIATALMQNGGDVDALPLSEPAFVQTPTQLQIVVKGLPQNLTAEVWLDDPVSPKQSGLGNGGLAIAPVKPGTWQLFGRAGTLRVGPIPIDLSRPATGSLDFAPDASPAAALPAPRAGAASATLLMGGSSRMVVAGGLVGPLDNPRATDSVLAFDGSAWETLSATMSQAVSHGAFAAHSSELWVLGGIRPDGSVSSAIQRLDADTGTWTQLPQTLVSPSYLASARFLSNTLYVTAGLERRGDGSFQTSPWIYRMDLLTRTWTILGDQLGEPKLATARYGSACATVDGKLFVLSGVTASGDLTRSVEIVDPATGTSGAVRSAAPIPTPRFGAVAWVASGKIHVAGGVTALGKALDAVEVYDVASDRWEVRPPMKVPRGFAARGVMGDRAYVAGGHDGAFSPGFGVSPLDAVEALRLEVP